MKKTISSLRAVLITIKNKKTIMKVGLMIMALTTMITMNACSKINNETSNDVCVALAEKYGEDFVAVKIGDRFNTDSAKLYVHPKNNEEVLFTARINKDSGIVEDNYIEEKINYQVENVLLNAFLAKGISVSSRSMVVTKDPILPKNDEYTPKDFSEKYNFNDYMIYLIIKNGDYSAVDILEAIKNANDKIGVKLVIAGYVFDEQAFERCKSSIKEYPDISITMIEELSPVCSFGVNVDSKECSITSSELSKILGRS